MCPTFVSASVFFYKKKQKKKKTMKILFYKHSYFPHVNVFSLSRPIFYFMLQDSPVMFIYLCKWSCWNISTYYRIKWSDDKIQSQNISSETRHGILKVSVEQTRYFLCLGDESMLSYGGKKNVRTLKKFE